VKKEKRQAVYKKYNGHCAYCAKKIDYKDMQVDRYYTAVQVQWQQKYS